MSKKLLEKMKRNWLISYDPYSDIFQIYDEVVFETSKEKITKSKSNNISFVFIEDSKEPVLIEVKNAYSEFDKEIDSLKKEEVIKLISLKIGESYVAGKR